MDGTAAKGKLALTALAKEITLPDCGVVVCKASPDFIADSGPVFFDSIPFSITRTVRIPIS